MTESRRKVRGRKEREALNGFLGRSVKTKTPAEMVLLFPFLEQPGLQCLTIQPAVAGGILLALETHRQKG
jgi:hypothetical protein